MTREWAGALFLTGVWIGALVWLSVRIAEAFA